MASIRLFAAALITAAPATAAVPSLPSTPPPPVMAPPAPAPAGATVDRRPAPDPVRLALANEVAAITMPAGTLQRAMAPQIERLNGARRNAMLNAPMVAFVRAAGIKPSKQIRIDEGVAMQAMAVLDPAFAQRDEAISAAMDKAIGTIVAEHEPKARAAIAQAYAQRLSLGELQAALAFLKTPAGAAMADIQANIIRDPAIAASNDALLAQLSATLPATMKDVAAATRSLPPPRRYADLNESQKAEIFKLIGATPADVAPVTIPAPVK